MPARVTLASARPKELRSDATLPALMGRMLKRWGFKKRFDGKRVAVKMHLGFGLGYSTIHPLLVRTVVQAVKDAGGTPFVTDVPSAVRTAAERGYTAEVLGAPLVAVAGPADKHVYTRRVNYRTLKSVNLAGNVADADAMIVLSHGKGHGHSGFGGAIKNIAMGCVDGKTRGGIHRLMSAAFEWDTDKCTGCLLCRDNCPNDAVTFKDGKISIFDHACKYCMHCQLACPSDAITIDQRGFRYFQHGMAATVREALGAFDPGAVFYVTVLLQVTPFCDCWGFTTPSIVPDVGVIAGDEITAVETAALDLIRPEDFIEGSLPAPLARGGDGHLLEQIHGKDPYIQIAECIKLGLGDGRYRLAKVR
ncbi:MAG: DUF362 domain-containing protein [Planctomycetota bacterium]|jgi:uncharacterized Fe-S center protein